MPTYEEFLELLDNCTITRVTRGAKKGYSVKSKINGNSIFLPAAGYIDGTFLIDNDTIAYYWSSSLNEEDSFKSWCLYLYPSNQSIVNYSRCYGQSVRPVCP